MEVFDMKKITAIVLALVMALALTSPALASGAEKLEFAMWKHGVESAELNFLLERAEFEEWFYGSISTGTQEAIDFAIWFYGW